MSRKEKLARLEAEVPGGRIRDKKKLPSYGTASDPVLGRRKGVPMRGSDYELVQAVNKRREQLRKKRGVRKGY